MQPVLQDGSGGDEGDREVSRVDVLDCLMCEDGVSAIGESGEAVECRYCHGDGYFTSEDVIGLWDRYTASVGDRMFSEQLLREEISLLKQRVRDLSVLAKRQGIEIDTLRSKLSIISQDIADASGELMIDVPEPGTDLSKLVIANRLLKNRSQ